MALFKKRKKIRVCVIGLDGVPYSLLLELTQKGVMPALGRLVERGHLHKLKASLPEISAVSWTDFMTGVNSGSHGIFGFTDLKPGSYNLRFPNFLDVKTETFWDDLGRQNRKCIVINQPSTYPARKINGTLISGFVAIELAKAVYPLAHKAALEQMGYQIDIDTLKSREDPAFLWQELNKILAGRERALDYFWNEDWDYFEFVFTGTDRLHHFLWNAYEDATHLYHQSFLDYYARIDKVIAKLVTSFFGEMGGGEEGLFVLSDHGFCKIEQEVYLNAWLELQGHLRFDTLAPMGLDEMSDGSTAFALDPNRIYLNLKDRFPRGIVASSERNALRREISQKLQNLEYEGRKVIRKVFEAEDIYSGPLVSEGPDLVVLAQPGFDLKGSVKKKEVFGRTSLQGMHTWDDAFFLANRSYGDDLAISGLAKIIRQIYS